MKNLNDLRGLLPDLFRGILTDEHLAPQRIARWVEATGGMELGNLQSVCESYVSTRVENCLFPEPIPEEHYEEVSRLLGVNAKPLALIRDPSATPSCVALPVDLDGVPTIERDAYDLLESRLAPLSALQVIEARWLTYTGRHSDAVAPLRDASATAARLLRSSIPGTPGHQGYYHVIDSLFAALELGDVALPGEEDVLASLISQVDQLGVTCEDFVASLMLPFCTNVLHAVTHFTESNDAREILGDICFSTHFDTFMIPDAREADAIFSICGYRPSEEKEEDYNDSLYNWLGTNDLAEDNPLPFDRNATLREIQGSFSRAQALLTMTPGEVRRQCDAEIHRDFEPGLHFAWPTAVVQSGYLAARTRAELFDNLPPAVAFFRDAPNSLGKALACQVRRFFFWNLARTMGCWYLLRLTEEVALALLGIKSFTLRTGRPPKSLAEVVREGVISHVPEDPFSQTPLEYEPVGGILRVNPAEDEYRHWQEHMPDDNPRTWRVLRAAPRGSR